MNFRSSSLFYAEKCPSLGGEMSVVGPRQYASRQPARTHPGICPMKVVLFCGGLGTRIREYSENVPKPMIPVGAQPLLWHVMQYYSDYGHQDFILCLGYKANVIKDYFLNYRQTEFSDCTISDFGKKVEILGRLPTDWRVSLVDTETWHNN